MAPAAITAVPGCVSSVTSEHVEFLEGARVEEVLDALAGEHLALLVLALDRALRAGVDGLVAALAEVLQLGGHDVGWRRIAHGGSR
jgi:hypothetical protein